MAQRGRRVGVGLGLAVLGRVVDRGGDLGRQARLDLVGQDASIAELRTALLDAQAEVQDDSDLPAEDGERTLAAAGQP